MKEFIHQIQIDQNITSRIPGYLLIENTEEELKTQQILEEGIKRFFGGFGEFAYIYDLGGYKFALLMPEALPKMTCVSFFRNGDDFAFIEGTFYDYELLKKNKKEPLSTDLARRVLEMARNENYEGYKSYNGRYSGFAYIARSNKLSLITDSYGSNRVFMYNTDNSFVVSNNIFALSTNPALKVTVKEESIAQIIHYEYPAYRETEFNEISLVLPSDILIRHDKRNTIVKSFQKIKRAPIKKDREYINELRDTVADFFKRTSEYIDEPFGIYLSKGKDSRLFLPFLERGNYPYIPFVFKEDTGIFDYQQVKKIARLLDKDLHVMEKHTIDPNLAFLISMNTTPTTPWLALAKVAANYTGNALMGLYGESSSGKLCAYRNFGINSRESSIRVTMFGNSRGINREEAVKWVPYYKKFDTDTIFRHIYNEYPPVELAFDYDTYQDIDHRSFRNAVVILTRSQHFITPINPFMDKYIADVYHRLPHSLLKSQIAHTIIASEEKKSNSVKSTAFPVSLKHERYFRELMVLTVKLNNKYKNFLMARQKTKYKPFVDADSFVARSQYFKGVFGEGPVNIGNPRILTRLYNTDHYLYMTLEDNLQGYFKTPVIVQDELQTVRSGIKSSIIN